MIVFLYHPSIHVVYDPDQQILLIHPYPLQTFSITMHNNSLSAFTYISCLSAVLILPQHLPSML